MGAAQESFIFRMAGFDQTGTSIGMCPFTETGFIVKGQDIPGRCALIPGEEHFFARRLEIISHMALGTNQCTHFLGGYFVDIPALALQSIDQGRSAQAQFGSGGIMAIQTADGFRYFIYYFIKTHQEIIGSVFLHQFRHLGGFTGDTGGPRFFTGRVDGYYIFDGI